jgi:hypothetical protein
MGLAQLGGVFADPSTATGLLFDEVDSLILSAETSSCSFSIHCAQIDHETGVLPPVDMGNRLTYLQLRCFCAHVFVSSDLLIDAEYGTKKAQRQW